MFQVFCLKYSHNSGYAQSVVSSQSSTFGLHPITVNVRFNRVFSKIMNRIVVLLRHHVHVCLQNDTFSVFHTWCSRFTDNDIANLVNK